MKSDTIIMGSDHAAYQMKETIKSYLEGEGFAVEDAGTLGDRLRGLSRFRDQGGIGCIRRKISTGYPDVWNRSGDVHGCQSFPGCQGRPLR